MLTFKDILAKSGPDRIKSAMKSRIQRLTESMPPVVTEMLERRRLLSLTVSFDAGTLEIDGTSGADYISLRIGTTPDTLIQISDGLGGTYTEYNPANVTLVKILAGGGNDSVYINRTGANTLNESCLIYGEAGNDSVNAGVLADTVYGGDGLDSIYGWEGNDVIYGGAGNDLIYGGDGNDSINGEDGDDSILGEANNDSIHGDSGFDTIDGGDDNDSLYGDADNDSISGGLGLDRLYGGDGNDTLLTANDGSSDTLDGGPGTDCASVDPSPTDVVTNVEGFYP